MEKQKRTELVFILDRSGSMSGLEEDTIGGYNAMLKKQLDTAGEVAVTTVLFDDRYELLHDRIDLKALVPMSAKEYYVRGSTALLDAVGRTIAKIRTVQQHTTDAYQAGQVLFVIITDGLENASREYTFHQIQEMVEYQKKVFGWEFLFLGANMDAAETARKFGVDRQRAATYHADKEGTHLNYKVMSETITAFRETAAVADDWKQEIDEDYRHRQN